MRLGVDSATRRLRDVVPETVGFILDSSCRIELPSCPRSPSYVGTFVDDYEHASADVAICMRRASDLYAFCGGAAEMQGERVTATFLSGLSTVRSVTVPP